MPKLIQGCGARVWGLRLRVEGFRGLGVAGSGFRGLGYRV